MRKQSEATVNTILAVLKERGIDYELNGDKPMSEVITKDDRAKVSDILMTGFKKNEIAMTDAAKAKYNTDPKLKNYVGGLISNWVRKHKPFNCGQAHTPKYTRETDETIKELNKLLACDLDEQTRETVQAEIDKRKAEIRAEKNAVEIDTDKLPEHLRHLVG